MKAADGGQVHLRLDLPGVLNLARDEDLEREHVNDHLKAPNPSSTPVMPCLSSLFLSVRPQFSPIFAICTLWGPDEGLSRSNFCFLEV